jgi:hypothetical protein
VNGIAAGTVEVYPARATTEIFTKNFSKEKMPPRMRYFEN